MKNANETVIDDSRFPLALTKPLNGAPVFLTDSLHSIDLKLADAVVTTRS